MTTSTNMTAGSCKGTETRNNQTGLAVKTRVKAGAITSNHNQMGRAVKTR